MKKLIFFIIPVIIIGLLGFLLYKNGTYDQIRYLLKSPCDQPIEYSIGTIDPEFNLSQDELRVNIQKATAIWEDVAQKNLFEYNPTAKLTVNLVYDERQSALNKVEELKNKIEGDKSSLEKDRVQYNILAYDFSERLQAFNEQVNYWNSRGGAPPAEYAALKQEQVDLQKEAEDLDSLAAKLNLTATDYNSQLGELSQSVANYNQNIYQKPEEGIYLPAENKINIYLIVDQNELIHTLTHELGHALGLGHVYDNEKAMMYLYANNELGLSEEDTKMLNYLCQNSNFTKIFNEKKSIFFEVLTSILASVNYSL